MVSKNRIENALDMYAFIASFPEIRVVLDFFCCLEYNVKREITTILRRLYHRMRIICRPADKRCFFRSVHKRTGQDLPSDNRMTAQEQAVIIDIIRRCFV